MPAEMPAEAVRNYGKWLEENKGDWPVPAGIGVENYNDLKVGDLIECFTMVEQARKLEQAQK